MKKTLIKCAWLLVIIFIGFACIGIALMVKLLRYVAHADTQAAKYEPSQVQPVLKFNRVTFDKETKQLKRKITI